MSLEKTAEFEAEEKKRQMPFHFQINVQLLECIHFITSMLIEVPLISANQFTMNKTTVSRNFRKLVEQYDTHAFTLAAENYRDHIVWAARALNQSDWKKAVESIFRITFITRMHEFQSEEFRNNLKDAF